MLRVMTWVVQWTKMFRQSVNKGNDNFERKVSIDSSSVEQSRTEDHTSLQNIYFENEIQILKGIANHKMLERSEPPFAHYGVDIFGPFLIKERRNTLKQ